MYNRPGLFSNGSNSSNSSSRPKTPSSPSKRPLPPSTPTESKFLLDFDIPPPATPRSIPSITPREVETLKSEYLTQLAGLKAEIKGKQVMVQDLKEAVGDAERRCGVYREELDNLKGELEDALNVQRQLEEKLGRVRGMIQELERNVAEAESAKRAAEEKAERAEKSEEEGRRINEEMGRKMQMLENLHDEEKVKRRKLEVEVDKLRTEVASAKNTPGPNTAAQAPSPTTGGGTSKEEVDRIAKELHLLYKQKHETKVAALKKSYEARWQKKIIEQEKTIAQLQETVANQKNMGGQNTTIAQQQETITKQQKVLAQQEREIETLTKKAEMANSSAPVSDVAADESKKLVENLNSELGELKKENAVLKKDLEKERKEKGELVGAVEEMLILQHGGGSSPVAVPSL